MTETARQPHALPAPEAQRGDDCKSLRMRQLERMPNSAGFHDRMICIEAWRALLEAERRSLLSWYLWDATQGALTVSFKWITTALIHRFEPQHP